MTATNPMTATADPDPTARDRRERVVLLDQSYHEIGTMPKLEAHRRGVLHAAFSVFLTDGQGRMLIQRRAAGKYHAPLVWANSACGHPRPGEALADAAARRTAEELGVAVPLAEVDRITYRADVGGGLVEHERVGLFVGRHAGPFQPDPAEVADLRWVDWDRDIRRALGGNAALAPWFAIYLDRVFDTVADAIGGAA